MEKMSRGIFHYGFNSIKKVVPHQITNITAFINSQNNVLCNPIFCNQFRRDGTVKHEMCFLTNSKNNVVKQWCQLLNNSQRKGDFDVHISTLCVPLGNDVKYYLHENCQPKSKQKSPWGMFYPRQWCGVISELSPNGKNGVASKSFREHKVVWCNIFGAKQQERMPTTDKREDNWSRAGSPCWSRAWYLRGGACAANTNWSASDFSSRCCAAFCLLSGAATLLLPCGLACLAWRLHCGSLPRPS